MYSGIFLYLDLRILLAKSIDEGNQLRRVGTLLFFDSSNIFVRWRLSHSHESIQLRI